MVIQWQMPQMFCLSVESRWSEVRWDGALTTSMVSYLVADAVDGLPQRRVEMVVEAIGLECFQAYHPIVFSIFEQTSDLWFRHASWGVHLFYKR